MASIDSINQSLGDARNAVYEKMSALITDKTMDSGDKTNALLSAQAELGITDGVQNILSKGYNRWQQTGQ